MKANVGWILIALVVVLALGYGLSQTGGPRQNRMERLDEERLSRLSDLQRAVHLYYKQKKTLPKDLEAARSYLSSRYDSGLPVDPDTGAAFEFRLLTPGSYELCAVFQTDNRKGAPDYDSPNDDYLSWGGHAEGHQCFRFEARNKYEMNRVRYRSYSSRYD